MLVWYRMLVKLYKKLKMKLDHVRSAQKKGKKNALIAIFQRFVLRILIQIIVFPHFMLLGPFKTFTHFARTDEQGTWIDSYNEFVVSNRITIGGLASIVLIGIVAVLTFIYLPVLYF